MTTHSPLKIIYALVSLVFLSEVYASDYLVVDSSQRQPLSHLKLDERVIEDQAEDPLTTLQDLCVANGFDSLSEEQKRVVENSLMPIPIHFVKAPVLKVSEPSETTCPQLVEKLKEISKHPLRERFYFTPEQLDVFKSVTYLWVGSEYDFVTSQVRTELHKWLMSARNFRTGYATKIEGECPAASYIECMLQLKKSNPKLNVNFSMGMLSSQSIFYDD